VEEEVEVGEVEVWAMVSVGVGEEEDLLVVWVEVGEGDVREVVVG
jgi:hypothetical protein